MADQTQSLVGMASMKSSARKEVDPSRSDAKPASRFKTKSVDRTSREGGFDGFLKTFLGKDGSSSSAKAASTRQAQAQSAATAGKKKEKSPCPAPEKKSSGKAGSRLDAEEKRALRRSLDKTIPAEQALLPDMNDMPADFLYGYGFGPEAGMYGIPALPEAADGTPALADIPVTPEMAAAAEEAAMLIWNLLYGPADGSAGTGGADGALPGAPVEGAADALEKLAGLLGALAGGKDGGEAADAAPSGLAGLGAYTLDAEAVQAGLETANTSAEMNSAAVLAALDELLDGMPREVLEQALADTAEALGLPEAGESELFEAIAETLGVEVIESSNGKAPMASNTLLTMLGQGAATPEVVAALTEAETEASPITGNVVPEAESVNTTVDAETPEATVATEPAEAAEMVEAVETAEAVVAAESAEAAEMIEAAETVELPATKTMEATEQAETVEMPDAAPTAEASEAAKAAETVENAVSGETIEVIETSEKVETPEKAEAAETAKKADGIDVAKTGDADAPDAPDVPAASATPAAAQESAATAQPARPHSGQAAPEAASLENAAVASTATAVEGESEVQNEAAASIQKPVATNEQPIASDGKATVLPEVDTEVNAEAEADADVAALPSVEPEAAETASDSAFAANAMRQNPADATAESAGSDKVETEIFDLFKQFLKEKKAENSVQNQDSAQSEPADDDPDALLSEFSAWAAKNAKSAEAKDVAANKPRLVQALNNALNTARAAAGEASAEGSAKGEKDFSGMGKILESSLLLTANESPESAELGQSGKQLAGVAILAQSASAETGTGTQEQQAAPVLGPSVATATVQNNPAATTAHSSAGSSMFEQIENIERLTDAMRMANKGGIKNLTLQLTPDELGKVMLKVESRNGVVNAYLRVEKPEAAAQLANNLGQLRENLKAQGIELGELDIRQQQHGQALGDFGGHRQRRNQETDPDANGKNVRPYARGEQDEGDEAIPVQGASRRDATGGLNFFA